VGESRLVSELPHDPFGVGSIVSLRADASRTGAIIAELPAIGGRRRFNVYHSPTRSRVYFEDQLQPVARSGGDEWAEALADGQFVDPVEFRARLTATRLNNPQTDHLYSLRSARIQFIPFQFKPILRLLRADRPRLLIADDVGVGKTIEAGLILKELSTRQDLQNVLVLCPKALTTKWRAEMRRFDEDFRILTAETLRYCLDEADMEGEWPQEYSRSIVHYELFRMSSYLTGTEGGRRHRGLLELDPAPQFDLVIADEAHHLRTPGSGGHQLIERLCLTAEAVLMLTATPVQIHRDNLYTLLHLLRPELFQDKQVFEDVIAPNRFLTSAAKVLRAGPCGQKDWVTAAATAVQEAANTTWGTKVLRADRRFQEVATRLSGDSLDDEGRVRSIRDLEELHSLAHVMNRTRRRDIGRFTIREPRTVSVPFTPEQRRLYDAVLAFREKVLLQKHDPLVVRLILDTLERQAESSINALSATVDSVLASGDLSISDVTDDPEAEDPGGAVPDEVVATARDFVAAAASLSAEDPKFDHLHEIVSMTMEDSESPGKILVFSYFLNTISYLYRRLVRSGVRAGVVTGRNSDEEREDLRRRFRLDRGDPDAIDVLLSSEVGCEGLDYEFCDRLVNYDIPWNPMRIEQRIGRIDRFGQRSDKVLIFNFITPDTVAERVFYRCFERLGVFQDSVGDLEDVLGEITQDLNRVALDPSLSPQQVAERTRQISDNAIRQVEEQRRLDEESGSLLGLDDAFTNEVEEVVSGGRFVDESDLHCLIDAFLKQPLIRGSLVKDASPLVCHLRVSEHTRRELTSRVQEAGRSGRLTTSFVRALEAPGDILLTFDQQSAAQHRELEFITPVHPLARAATAYWMASDTQLVVALQVTSDLVLPGRYAFTCEVWETLAVRPDLRMVCLAVDAESGKVATELSRVFLSLLPATRPLGMAQTDISSDALAESFNDLDAASDAQRRELTRGLAETNEVLVSRKLASLQSFHDGRVRRLQGDLQEASEPRIIRMRKSELARVEDDFARRRSALEAARQVDVVSERVAAGIIEVIQ
jgi:ATP-dependent helicase HepA